MKQSNINRRIEVLEISISREARLVNLVGLSEKTTCFRLVRSLERLFSQRTHFVQLLSDAVVSSITDLKNEVTQLLLSAVTKSITDHELIQKLLLVLIPDNRDGTVL